jgi:hypothetical protein
MVTEDCATRELFETGAEPDYSIFDLERWEEAGDGNIRVYVTSRRGKTDKTEYSFTCTPDRLARVCRKGLMFAAEAHNAMQIVASNYAH